MKFPPKYAKSPDNSTGFALFRAANLYQQSSKRVLAEFDMTHSQFAILMSVSYLARQGLVRQVDVSCFACIDPMTTSQVVKTLSKKGWLIRETSADDRRAFYLRVAPAGEVVLKAAFLKIEKHNAEFFGKLDTDVNFRGNLLTLL